MLFANVDPQTPMTLLYELAEKSYVVNDVGAYGGGMGTWVSLSPAGNMAAVSPGPVLLNLQGTQQMTHLAGLVGQPVSFGPVPTVVGGAGKYVAFYPLAEASSSDAVTGGSYLMGSEPGSHSAMLKLSGSHSADQVLGHSDKVYTVVKSKMAAGGGSKLFLVESCDAAQKVKDIFVINVKNGPNETATLVGKSFCFGKAPAASGGAAGKYILLKPAAAGAAGKTAVAGTALAGKGAAAGKMGMAGKATVVKGAPAAASAPGAGGMQVWWSQMFGGGGAGAGAGTAGVGAQMPVAAKVAGGGAVAGGLTGKTVAAATVGKSAAATGTMWTGAMGTGAMGTGAAVGGGGLGFGLGMGPLLVVGLAVATAYGVGRYRKKLRDIEATG